MSTTVLVVAAHPDDEVLGCGGTVARHALAGDRCHSLILAEGATARRPVRDTDAQREEVEALREAGRSAAAVLGAEAPHFAGFPDNRMDGVELLDIVKVLEGLIDSLAPSVVYTHYQRDLNIDHRIVHDAVLTACRPIPGRQVRAIHAYETVSSTEWGAPSAGSAFTPTRYVNIAAVLDRKLDALRCYEREMRDFPHARSLRNVEALARYRGASAGLDAAEAFVTEREIIA